MRLRSIATGMTAVVALAGFMPSAAPVAQTSQIIGFSYAPDPLQVSVGDTVSWQNVAPNVDHTATVFATVSNPFAFDTSSIAQGAASAPITMTTPGTYTVICTFHGTSMRQQLVVSESEPPVVPDAPFPVLLGASAVAVLGATGLLAWRRHRVRASVVPL